MWIHECENGGWVIETHSFNKKEEEVYELDNKYFYFDDAERAWFKFVELKADERIQEEKRDSEELKEIRIKMGLDG